MTKLLRIAMAVVATALLGQLIGCSSGGGGGPPTWRPAM